MKKPKFRPAKTMSKEELERYLEFVTLRKDLNGEPIVPVDEVDKRD